MGRSVNRAVHLNSFWAGLGGANLHNPYINQHVQFNTLKNQHVYYLRHKGVTLEWVHSKQNNFNKIYCLECIV